MELSESSSIDPSTSPTQVAAQALRILLVDADPRHTWRRTGNALSWMATRCTRQRREARRWSWLLGGRPI